MPYPDQFEPCISRHDLVFVGIENADTPVKAWHLCPYSNRNIKHATSFEAMSLRIIAIDKVIAEGVKL